MAVAFNNANTMQYASGHTFSGSMSVTAGGSNIVAICVIAFDDVTGLSISSVTYGGQTMTSCGAAVENATGFEYAQAFYLANPPTGANTLAITASSSTIEMYINLISFTGVNQTTPVRPGSYTTQTGTGASISLVVSSATTDLCVSVTNAGANGQIDTNQASAGYSASGNYSGAAAYNITGAASVTFTWSGGTGDSAAVAFSLQPPGAAFNPIPPLLPDGPERVRINTLLRM